MNNRSRRNKTSLCKSNPNRSLPLATLSSLYHFMYLSLSTSPQTLQVGRMDEEEGWKGEEAGGCGDSVGSLGERVFNNPCHPKATCLSLVRV